SFTYSRILRTAEASTAGASFVSTNVFIKWYLQMIGKRPILTKSITAASIFTAADFTSQSRYCVAMGTGVSRPSLGPCVRYGLGTHSLSWLNLYMAQRFGNGLMVISFAVSDALHVSDKLEIDEQRTMRMAGYGLLLSGPTLHLWFNFMSRILPKTDIISTVKKMVLGQALYGPVITVVFFSLNALLQGENGSEIFARLKRDFLPTIKSGAMYWPLCDFITYRYVPVQLQ
ncbi:hypothetical protein KI387_008084, partial [Taxus chinensis]